MTALPLDHIKQDLEAFVARVLSDAEPVMVETSSGQRVVVMPLEDFASWQETAYLLKNPSNAAHLRKSIEEATEGKFNARQLDDR